MYFVSSLLKSCQETQDSQKVESIEKCRKHLWQYNEIRALITSMESHFEELSHPRKRKHVFENVSNDLLSSGFICSAAECQAKWKSLMRSYNVAKDNKNKTGRGPNRFQFFEEIDAIVGTKPSNNCEHTLESSSEASTSTSTMQHDENDQNIDNCEGPEEPAAEVEIKSVEKKGQKRRRINRYEYLQEKQKYEDQKTKRHSEKMELEKQKMEIEKEKLAVLREYLNKK